MSKQKILVVEDDPNISKLIAYNLEKAGYECALALTGEEALEGLKKHPIHFVVLDVMLPGMDGLEFCRTLKQDNKFKNIPIIMLTAKGEEVDRIVGFEVGADDYMVKPFSPRELVLRIKAILKRSGKSEEEIGPSSPLQLKGIELDPVQHRVWIEKKEVVLTATEFKLLEYLLRSQGRVLTRDLLLDKVWGYDVAVTTRTVDTYIKRLREKLGKGGDCIETVRGVGYRLKESF